MRAFRGALPALVVAGVVAAAACSGSEPTSPAVAKFSGPNVPPPHAQRNPYAGRWRSFVVGTRDLGPFKVLPDGRFTVRNVRGFITTAGQLSGDVVQPTPTPPGAQMRFAGDCPSLGQCDGATIPIGEQPSILVKAVR